MRTRLHAISPGLSATIVAMPSATLRRAALLVGQLALDLDRIRAMQEESDARYLDEVDAATALDALFQARRSFRKREPSMRFFEPTLP